MRTRGRSRAAIHRWRGTRSETFFITYLGNANTVETILSTDGGQTFTNLRTFGPASVDSHGGCWRRASLDCLERDRGQMVASGAPVTGLGTANIGASLRL